MFTDIDEIRGTILPVTIQFGVAPEHVTVEADQDIEGYDFLRVQITLSPGETPDDEQLLTVLEAIEEAVAKVDDRTVSVRFDDPN